jgi:hypothetical protein
MAAVVAATVAATQEVAAAATAAGTREAVAVEVEEATASDRHVTFSSPSSESNRLRRAIGNGKELSRAVVYFKSSSCSDLECNHDFSVFRRFVASPSW